MAKVVLKFNQNSEKSFNLDDGDIVSLNSLAQTTPDASGINYGSIANTGSIEVVDYNGNIANMIESGELQVSNMAVDVLFNGNKIQSHITTDSSYDENAKTLNISISNTVKDLSTRIFSGYNYSNKSVSAYDLLYYVMNEWFGGNLDEYTQFQPMLSSDLFYSGTVLSGTVERYLDSITIRYPVIEPNQTFEQVINQICALAQIQLFIDNNGNFKFISSRPVANLDKIIHIPARNICGEFKKDVFVKNKYDGVEVLETNVKDEQKKNQNVFTQNFDISNAVLSNSSVGDINSGVRDYKKIGQAFTNGYYNSEYPNAFMQGAVGFVYIKPFYHEIKDLITIPKTSNNGLLIINDLLKTLDYKVVGKKVSKSTTLVTNTKTEEISSITVNSFENSEFDDIEQVNMPTDITVNRKLESSFFGYSNTYITDKATITLDNETSMTITEDSDNYYVNYNILCGYDVIEAGINNTLMIWFPTSLSLSGTITRFKPSYATINIFGNTRVISFEDSTFQSDGFANAKNTVSIRGGKLMSDKTTYGSKVSKIISDSILSDYSNGIRTAKLTVVPVDYYDINGNIAVDSNSGGLIQISDIVEVEGQLGKDNETIKWRVTGSNFKYDGEPLQELELMEMAFIKDSRLIYYPTVTGLAYLVRASNTDISGKIVLGGQYDDGENGLMDVVAIEERGFASCKNITEVVINKPISTSFTRSFAYSGVKTVIFNNSPESGTGDLAFEMCENLETVYFLGGLYGIGDRAFMSCPNLKELYIGKNVQHISQYAFYGCTSLTNVYYEGSEEDWKNMSFKSATGNDLLYNANFHFNYVMPKFD